jgi:hypothetical protein
MLLLLSQMDFSERYMCFFKSPEKAYGTKRGYLHPEKCKLQEGLLSKTNSILTVKKWATCSFFGYKWISVEIQLFRQLS